MRLSQRSGPTLPRRRPLATIVGFVTICVLLGVANGFITTSQIGSWYVTVEKPWFMPPNWILGPIWTVMYALQGAAAWLLWRVGLEERMVRIALGLFAVQFALNMAWPPIFFGFKSSLLGLVVIIPLWLAIVGTMSISRRVDYRAALLLVPYLTWVSFATALNYAIWTLN